MQARQGAAIREDERLRMQARQGAAIKEDERLRMQARQGAAIKKTTNELQFRDTPVTIRMLDLI
jgi:hypothetical protein